jgi:hypothetical protein
MSYQELFDKDIPEIIKKFSQPNWDDEGAAPTSSETIRRATVIIKKLQELNVFCPVIYPSGEGDLEITWHWSKGDWTISIDEQERYSWDLLINVSEVIDDDNKTDCFFLEFDCREGVSKSFKMNEAIFFNYTDIIPDKVIEIIKEFEKWIKERL